MRKSCNYIIILVLTAISLPVAAADFETPGIGFSIDMDWLVDFSEGLVTAGQAVGGVTDYFVSGGITIARNDTLDVEGGERLIFLPETLVYEQDGMGNIITRQLGGYTSSLEIEGRFRALGSRHSNIEFLSLAQFLIENGTGKIPFFNPVQEDALLEDMLVGGNIGTLMGVSSTAPGQWRGLRFNNPSGLSVVRYARIYGAERGVECAGVSSENLEISFCTIERNFSAIHLTQSSPVISDCRSLSFNDLKVTQTGIAFWSGSGVFMWNNSSPLIRRCTFGANEANAITIYFGAAGGSIPKLGFASAGDVLENPGKNTFRIITDPDTGKRIGQRHVFNGTPNIIYAHLNDWGVYDPEVIDSVYIYDDDENPDSGAVIFENFLEETTAVDRGHWQSYR